MRFGTVLFLLAVSFCSFADDMPKFHYLAGYTDVQVLKVNHRGILISHSSGSSYLNVNDLSESDRRRLAKEIEVFKVRKKEYDVQQAKLKKQRAIEAKKQKAELKKRTAAQNKEIDALIKQFSKKNVYDTLIFFEKKFGIYQSNRHLGLKGRVRSVVMRIEKQWPLAKKVKQSFQPKPAKAVKVITTTDKDGKKSTKYQETPIAQREPPVLMNLLSKSIVLKRIELEDKIYNKAKSKSKPAGEPSQDGENGENDAPAEEAPEGGEENQEQ
ncbi:MAG: hypothetical protein E7054_04815 [Lentisphaerae bacterium]|nr:hypothetical protein [Lentisphaerota bacterium]